MNLLDATVIVQNASLNFPADVWTSCGLPENATDGPFIATDSAGNKYPVVLDGDELLVRCPLGPGEKKELVLGKEELEVELSAPGTASGGPYSGIPITAFWCVPDGHRFTSPSDGVNLIIRASSGAGHGGIERVDMTVDGGPIESITSKAMHRPDFNGDVISPLTGTSTWKRISGYGRRVSAGVPGTRTITATVYTVSGQSYALPSFTIYDDSDGTDRRPNPVTYYVDPVSGNDADDGLTEGNAVLTIDRGLQLIGADLSGAELILMTGTHVIDTGSYGVPDNGTTGKHHLTITVRDGAILERPGALSPSTGAYDVTQPDHLIQLNGKSGLNIYAKFVFLGTTKHINKGDLKTALGVGSTGRFTFVGGIAEHPEWAPGKVSVLYGEGTIGGIDPRMGGQDPAEVEYFGTTLRGVERGHTLASKLVECEVDGFVGVASESSTLTMNAANVRFKNQAYDKDVEGYVDSGVGGKATLTKSGSTVTLTIDAGQTIYQFKGGILSTTVEMDLAVQAAALIGSTKWGVKLMQDDGSTYWGVGLGAHSVTSVGYDGGTGQAKITWEDAGSGTGAIPANVVLQTWRAPGQTDEPWIGAVHPDVHQILRNPGGQHLYGVFCEDVKDTPSIAVQNSQTNCDGLHIINSNDGGTGLVMDLYGASEVSSCVYTDILLEHVTLTGDISFSSTAAHYERVATRKCVFGAGVTNLPVGGDHECQDNHFVSATAQGDRPTTGPWFKNDPSIGDDLTPADVHLNAAAADEIYTPGTTDAEAWGLRNKPTAGCWADVGDPSRPGGDVAAPTGGAELPTSGNRTTSRGAPRNFVISSWVTDELQKIVPVFTAMWDEQEIQADPIRIVGKPKINGARIRYEIATRFQPGVPLYVQGWIDIFDNQELVEFKFILSWGNLEGEHQQGGGVNHTVTRLGKVWCSFQEKAFVDHHVNKGIQPAAAHQGAWRFECADTATWWVNTNTWHYASGIRVTGAIACLPPPDEINASLLTDPRFLNLQHREEASVRCMLAPEHWEGRWGPCGHIPNVEDPDGRAFEFQDFYDTVYNRNQRPLSENPYLFTDCPEYINRPETGATGEQPDFGATNCVQVMSHGEPGALHWYQRDLDACFRRPYFYRYADGSMISRHNHPNCATNDGRPNLAFGSDSLGTDLPLAPAIYPSPGSQGVVVGVDPTSHWSGAAWWHPFNDQHRSNNLLYGLWSLTKDPSIQPLVRGQLELDMMVYWLRLDWLSNPPHQGTGVPRGWGRPLMAHSWAYKSGFKWIGSHVKRCIEQILHDWAGGSSELQNASMRPFDRWQTSYGFTTPAGDPIFGVSPWQETILLMGVFAAWKLGLYPEGKKEEVREMMIAVGKTIRDYCIYDYNGTYQIASVYGWNGGEPWPQSQLYPGTGAPGDPGFNSSVLTWNGWAIWTIPAVRIMQELDPSTRGEEILSVLGESSDLLQAQWNAVTEQPV